MVRVTWWGVKAHSVCPGQISWCCEKATRKNLITGSARCHRVFRVQTAASRLLSLYNLPGQRNVESGYFITVACGSGLQDSRPRPGQMPGKWSYHRSWHPALHGCICAHCPRFTMKIRCQPFHLITPMRPGALCHVGRWGMTTGEERNGEGRRGREAGEGGVQALHRL